MAHGSLLWETEEPRDEGGRRLKEEEKRKKEEGAVNGRERELEKGEKHLVVSSAKGQKERERKLAS